MADDRKIIIELSVAGSDDEDKDGKSTDEEKEAEKRNKKIKSVIKQTIGTAYQEVKAQVLYNYEKYTSLSDDYKTAILISNVETSVNKVISIGKSTMSTAMLGAEIGGPWGAAIGAVVGLGTSIVHTALDLSRQYQTQSLNLYLADKESKYAMSHLGLIDNGRGTQN